jgi:hypothetical protein
MSGLAGTRQLVQIEWMDGKTATVEAAAEPVVTGGVLRIQQWEQDGPGHIGRTVNFPVANIRSWE